MAKKILVSWRASHEAVLGLTLDEDIDIVEFEKDLNESDPADPNGALAKVEQMTREGKVDFLRKQWEAVERTIYCSHVLQWNGVNG